MKPSSLTTAHVLESLGTTALQKGATDRFADITTDSRKISADCLFVALSGDRFDGHEFAASSVQSGATGVVIERQRWSKLSNEFPEDCWVFGVEDTLKGLGQLAQKVRRNWGGQVLGVTGSAGKTTSKELLGAALASLAPVHLTPGNWNNRIGVPLTLFQLEEQNTAVIEMGTNLPGEIEELARIAEPNIAMITNVGAAHLEGLGSIEGVAEEKGAIFRGLVSEGLAIVNVDDHRVAEQAASSGKRCLSYGTSDTADIRLLRVDSSEVGRVHIELSYAGKERSLSIAGFGDHMGLNVAGAVACAIALGVPFETALEGLETYAPPQQRMNLRKVGEINVLDDCYNANPTSSRAALAAFGGLNSSGKRFAVLGDMLELGHQAEEEHRTLGSEAAELDLDGLIAVGLHGQHMAGGAKDNGASFPVWSVADASEAFHVLWGEVSPGDWVLVKGSRGVRLEHVIEGIEKGGL